MWVYVVLHFKGADVQKLNDDIFLRSVPLVERRMHF